MNEKETVDYSSPWETILDKDMMSVLIKAMCENYGLKKEQETKTEVTVTQTTVTTFRRKFTEL